MELLKVAISQFFYKLWLIIKIIKTKQMPLKKGSSAKIMKANISELVTSKPGAARKKAIKTMVKKTGMTPKQAKVKQAVAISYAKAGKSKKK